MYTYTARGNGGRFFPDSGRFVMSCHAFLKPKRDVVSDEYEIILNNAIRYICDMYFLNLKPDKPHSPKDGLV